MPDLSALYPQPPQPQQNALMQNPLSLATTVSGLQTQALQRQQLQLAITNEMYKAVAQGFGSLDPNSTADDVNSRAALLSRMYPNAAPIISHFQDRITSNPNGISHGLTESAIAASPERAAEPALGPPNPATGAQPYTTAAGNVYAGSPARTPLSTDTSFGMTSPRVPGAAPVTTTTYRAPATTLGLGAPESNAAMQRDQLAEGNFANETLPIQQALVKLKDLGPGATGPGEEARKRFQSWVTTLSPDVAHVFGVDTDKVKTFDELKKYLVAGSQQRAAQFGAHTDQQAATSLAASPNVSVNDLAVEDLLKVQLGQRRMQNALVNQAAKGGGPGYISQKAALAPGMDVRAFMVDQMSSSQIRNLQKTLKGPDLAKFNASLQIAYDHGLIQRPTRQTGQ